MTMTGGSRNVTVMLVALLAGLKSTAGALTEAMLVNIPSSSGMTKRITCATAPGGRSPRVQETMPPATVQPPCEGMALRF